MIKLIDILKEVIEDPEKGIDDVLKQHGFAYTEKELKECI